MFLFRLILLVLAGTACTASPHDVAFTIAEVDLAPEGITYDPITQAFFVGSTYKRRIVRVDAHGRAEDFTAPAQDSLWGVLGMTVDATRRHLWVATSHAGTSMPIQAMDLADTGRAAILKYNIDTGELLKRYALPSQPNAHFLNDLVVSQSGIAFITDTETRAIYTITPERDTLDQLLQLTGPYYPNGITLSDDERFLFVSLWGEVGRLALADTTFTLLALPDSVAIHADGLYFYQNSLLAIQPFTPQKTLSRFRLSPDYHAVLDETVLQADHPSFNQPTTGVIVDDRFYYIANSQIQAFQRLYIEYGEAYPLKALQDIVILKQRLN